MFLIYAVFSHKYSLCSIIIIIFLDLLQKEKRIGEWSVKKVLKLSINILSVVFKFYISTLQAFLFYFHKTKPAPEIL